MSSNSREDEAQKVSPFRNDLHQEKKEPVEILHRRSKTKHIVTSLFLLLDVRSITNEND